MTDREIRNLADAISRMLDRWARAAELREQKKYQRRIRRNAAA